MFNKLLQISTSTFTKIIRTNNSSQTPSLEQIAKDLPLPLRPSPIITPKGTVRLNSQQKHQLGIFIPESPFNPRLTKIHEKHYLQRLTKQLYNEQEAGLAPFVRILQNTYDGFSKGTTLSKYINLIYKDIYARFLIAKGLGVLWQGKFSNLGIINKYSQKQYARQQQTKAATSSLLNLISCSRTAIKKGKSIGLYSYMQKKFVDGNFIEIKTGKKIGYYVKMPLSHYGKYSEELDILTQKGGFMSMLVLVEDLTKLINPNALCIYQESNYVVLRKYDFINQKTEYLIVTNNIYQIQQKFFKQQGYEKHQTLLGKYLLELRCNNLPIIAQIQGYQRSQNSYLVNSQIDLGDYQRVKHSQIDHTQSFINESGQIVYEGRNTKIAVNSSQKQAQLLKLLGSSYNFVQIYEVIDHQLYFDESSKEILNLKLGDKYYINIGQADYQIIEKAFNINNTMVIESKVQIPGILKAKLPRQRRKLRKERKQLLKQVTDHLQLKQSLRSITNISISSFTCTHIRIPLIFKDSQVISYEQVLDQQDLQSLINGKLIDTELLKGRDYEIVWIFVSESLIRSLLFLNKANGDKMVHNVIIEPQSQTQELIPLAIHLNYILQRGRKVNGRRSNKNATFENNFSLIKLHPTLAQLQGKGLVNELLDGIAKSNSIQQYGLGLEALRLWTARRDDYLGDRKINDFQINCELKFSTSIRKVFWDCISILPPNRYEVTPTLYINNFMLDMIDCYITNIQEHYKNLDIHKAYVLTVDFFQNIVAQIYIHAIKKRIIAFPNAVENQQHFYVIRKIIELVPLISPIMPFSSFHISKHSSYKWPLISNSKFYQSIPKHNSMIKLRVDLQNKMKLNRLSHFIVFLPSLKPQFSERDLQLFLDVDKLTTIQPRDSDRVSSLLLNKSNYISSQQKLIMYKSDSHCIRCDPKSQNSSHLCKNCVSYLQQHVNESLKFWPQRSKNRHFDHIQDRQLSRKQSNS